MKILDADSMRAVDRAAIEEIGIPSLVLMENAAIGVVDAIGEVYPSATSAGILCGPGNNGGDGLAVARHLTIRGYQVSVRLVRGESGLSGDAEVQLGICRKQGVEIREHGGKDAVDRVVAGLADHDLVIDGLFGTGLKRPLTGFHAELVEALNSLPRPRVAIDIASGLDSSSATVPGPHVFADLTVTFGAPKIAHILYPACEAAGRVVVADLGVPVELIERAGGDLHLLTAEELAGKLPGRPADTHKGDYGHAVIWAGSVGKAGAAILAARAAVRAGAGLVTVMAPPPIVPTIDLGSIESMTLPLAVDPSEGLAADDLEKVLEVLAGKSVLAIGPGLGLEAGTTRAVGTVVKHSTVPLVLDADALNALSGSVDELAELEVEKVLTPHPGEMARLLGKTTAEIQANRLTSVRAAAEASSSVVVLKGHQTLIAAPSGRVAINPTGNPGMATGGVGDVLTGVIAALIGQGHDGFTAACLGVFLHGAAGDLAVTRSGRSGLAANDLIDQLPQAMIQLES